MRAVRVVAVPAVVVLVAAHACALVLEAMAGEHGSHGWEGAAWTVAAVATIGVGFVLATRRARNSVGWLLLATGAVVTAVGFADSYARYAVLAEPGALPGGAWAVLVEDRTWPLLFAFVGAIAWVFPDGRLPSRRWRPYGIAAALCFAGATVLSLFSEERFDAPFAGVASPLPPLPWSGVRAVLMLGALAGLVGGVFAVRTRFGRSAGVERLQLKWLVYAAVLVPAVVAVCVLEGAIFGGNGRATEVAMAIALTAVPVAIGVAVMRYRLYEIDRLINRTLVYGGLSAGLAAVFAAVSLALGVAIGSGSTLPTAAATLAVAVLFGPLRSRMQQLVDRRFAPARYRGLRMVERYLEDLRAGREPPEATGAMLGAALGDPGLRLLFWLPEAGVHVDAAGRVDELEGSGRARTPVRRGSFPLATVVHDGALAEQPDLLESVIERAGLAIEIARLRVEVRRQLAEVEASRTRIVTAGYEERRRLERDLHDGAQQRLVSIGLALRHLQGQLPAASAYARALDDTVAELACAIEELRELARGVRPAGLDEGLASALRELAARSRLRTSVEATDDRFDDRLETAAYFVASEALANAGKHARASRVVVSAARRNGNLIVCVRDDGVGGAVASEGSGLTGINDRVAALGGRLTIVSPPGEGTVVTAELPCGS